MGRLPIRIAHKPSTFSKLVWLMLVLIIGSGCAGNASREPAPFIAPVVISPPYNYIADFAVNEPTAQVALIVPNDEYSPQLGLGEARLVVEEIGADGAAPQFFSEVYAYEPRDVAWFDDDRLLYVILLDSDLYQMILWDFKANEYLKRFVPHNRLALSSTGDLVMWEVGAKSERPNELTFFELAVVDHELVLSEIGSTSSPAHLETQFVGWSSNGNEVIITAAEDSLKEFFVSDRVGPSSPITLSRSAYWQFSWHSGNNLVASSSLDSIVIFSLDFGCETTTIDHPGFFQPKWSNTGNSLYMLVSDASERTHLARLSTVGLAMVDESSCSLSN